MIPALYSASNLCARAEKIKKPLFKQTHKVTFHIIKSLGVVFSLSTLISKLSRAKIIGSFKFQVSLWLADLIGISQGDKSGRHSKNYGSLAGDISLGFAARDGSTVKSHLLRRQISLDYYTIPPATQARAENTCFSHTRRKIELF